MQKKLYYIIFYAIFLTSCGEEVLTQNQLDTSFSAGNIEAFEYGTCANSRFVKPPVDILFVVDNSGSTLHGSFQQIKSQIVNTVSTISSEFDYHIYIAPLMSTSTSNSEINSYPLMISNPDSIPNLSNVNVIQPDHLNANTFFSQATGNNAEHGFLRAYNIINSNRANGIFRNQSHTIVVMISDKDDTEVLTSVSGNFVFDSAKFNTRKQNFINLAQNNLQANSFRFISLVPHSNCNGWTTFGNYKRMSNELYDAFNLTDDPSLKNSRDLCSGNYSSLFSVVNNSIRHEILGHKYDHWKISSAQASNIQPDDITVKKVLEDGSQINIPESTTDGFEYLGYLVNQNTRFAPDPGEPATGLMIKLHGSAKVEYPDCIIANTRTPTEYFGYIPIPREPNVSTIQVIINGNEINQNSTNGWSYIGWREVYNMKVPGPTNASILPPKNRTGYFIKLNGSSVITNGDSINIYYKAKI